MHEQPTTMNATHRSWPALMTALICMLTLATACQDSDEFAPISNADRQTNAPSDHVKHHDNADPHNNTSTDPKNNPTTSPIANAEQPDQERVLPPLQGEGIDCPDGQGIPTSFADALQITPVETEKYNGAAALLAELDEQSLLVAWAANPKAELHITKVIGRDSAEEFVLPGYRQAYAMIVLQDAIHLLARSEDQQMDYLRLDLSGELVASHRLVEGGSADKDGTTWGDDILLDDGYNRMVATPEGFAAYFPISRTFGPGNIHQGDTLRLLSIDGSPQREGWGWGCSHSDSQRIAHNGTTLGTLCVKDCKPYGVLFDTKKPLASYKGGPCLYSGILAFGLSTLLPTTEGFVVLYSRITGETWRDGWRDPTELHFVRLDHQGEILSDNLVTSTGKPWQYSPSPQLAIYHDGYLAGWSEGQVGGASIPTVQRLDAQGTPMGEAETIDVSLVRGEFSTLSNGDIAWATKVDNRTLSIARIPACAP